MGIGVNKFQTLLLIALFQSPKIFAQQNIALMTKQPVMSQMTGNCYTHSGTDILEGNFLKEKRTPFVDGPHPLLLGGIVSGNVGRSNISSGMTCEFFNSAKNPGQEVCSVSAFNKYIASSGISVQKIASNIDKLDRGMQNLQKLFNKRIWTYKDKTQALEAADNILLAACTLGNFTNMNDQRFIDLVGDAEDIIKRLDRRRTWTGFIKEEIREFLTEEMSPLDFMFSKRIINLDKDNKDVMNDMLKEVYKNLNNSCVKYAVKNKLNRIPRDFFATSAKYTCVDDIYKNPRRVGQEQKNILNFIEKQVRAGYPTGIYMCSAIFYGRGPKVHDYRDKDGSCINGGGHAVTVTGLEYIDGKRFFKIRNSWGTGSCGSLKNGITACKNKKQTGCPSDKHIFCKDGVYYMNDEWLGLGLYGHARLTVKRSK